MARKKIKLAWIVNSSARRTSLKKRRLGLLKKVSELNTLCDVSTCVIIYIPDDNEPTVWPSPFLVQQMLGRFYDLPGMERQKKMLDHETYLRERVDKLQEKTMKNQRKNNKAEMSYLMHKISENEGFDELSENELYRLTWLVNERMEEIGKMYEFLQQIPLSLQPGALPLLLSPPNQGLQNDRLQNEGMQVVQIDSRGADPSGGKETRIIFKNPPNQLDSWLEILNNNEKFGEGSSSNVTTEMEVSSHHAYVGSSSGIVANNMGMGLSLLHGGNSRLPSHDMALLPPHGSFRGYNDMWHLPPYGNVNVGLGNNSAGGIHDMELRPQPYGNMNYVGESSRIGGIQDMGFGMQPHGHKGEEGNNSIGGIPDMGFDLQSHGNWGEQNNSNIGGIRDMGFGLQPHGNLGGGDNMWSDVGKPFGYFKDGNSGGSI